MSSQGNPGVETWKVIIAGIGVAVTLIGIAVSAVFSVANYTLSKKDLDSKFAEIVGIASFECLPDEDHDLEHITIRNTGAGPARSVRIELYDYTRDITHVQSIGAFVDNASKLMDEGTRNTYIVSPTDKLMFGQSYEIELWVPRHEPLSREDYFKLYGRQFKDKQLKVNVTGENLIQPIIESAPLSLGDITGIPNTVTYTVKVGDTVSTIADQHGLTPSYLVQYNPVLQEKNIKPGQVLIIHQATCGRPIKPITPVAYPPLGIHVVRSNEDIYCIGRAYKVSPWSIVAANAISWPYLVYSGQELVIPAVPWYDIPSGPVCTPQF